MKKILAMILSIAVILSVCILPAAVTVSAEEVLLEAPAFSEPITVLDNSLNPRAIRTKVLSDGTVAAVYYKSGKGVFYATSVDGGVTFSEGKPLISNATDSELAASEEITTQTTIAKEYVAQYGEHGRGRLEAQNPNLIELSDGNIAAFYRYNTFTSDPNEKPWSIYYSSICYQILDVKTGKWSDVKVMVDTCNNKEITSTDSDYGFWEPDPVYITDEDGNTNLFVYYADTATPNNLSQQHIMYCVYNEDSDTFGEPAIAQNGTEHSSRDGMSVVTQLSDGTYAMVFESTKTNKDNKEDYITFVIKMSFSKDGRNWTDPVIVAKPDVAIRDLAFADASRTEYAVCASPYVVTLPDGRLAISYQTTDRFTGKTPNRVSYRVGSQAALSSQAITYDTFADNTINDDVTSYFPCEINPGVLGENEFSKSAELMIKDNKLYVYYGVGANIWDGDTFVKNDFGSVKMAYMQIPDEELDGSSLDNYIIYNNSGKTVTEADGVFTLPNGCTNMIYGESEKVDVFEKGDAVEGLYDISNYTTYANKTFETYMTIDTEKQAINFADCQTRNWIADTDNMTAFEASATIKGNSKGTIYTGFGFHMQADAFAASTFKYSTSGYTVIVKRSTTSANVEILVRYISGNTVYDETVNKITANGLIGTTVDETVKLKVWADNKNFYVVATNGDGTKSTDVYTYALDYTSSSGKRINWTSGGFMLTANGINTITNFELYEGSVVTVDSSKPIKAADLNASATFNFPETLTNDNQVGMSVRVQSAVDKPAPGVSGYVVKLLQTASTTDQFKVQLTRYGTKTDGTTNANLGNMYTENTAVLGDSAEAGSSIIMDLSLRDNILTVKLTNAANAELTSTHVFDLKKASGSYSDYYEYGGFGFFKNGNATDITVSDVSFEKLAKNVNRIASDSIYTVYRPEESSEVSFENNAFVNNDATAKKIILNDTTVTDFKANAIIEAGADGNLKGGIIFRAQNIGGETNAMDGYSAVVFKTPNTTTNYGRMVLLIYKWARLADGTMDYMGTVGSKAYADLFSSVYPEAAGNLLAAAGAKVKLNLAVEGDTAVASFDVLNSDNIIAASSAELTVNLGAAPGGVDKNKVFAEDAATTVYNAGAIGLSMSTLGKICDFNITEMDEGMEVSSIAGYDIYSSNSNSLVTDSINNKIYSTTTGQKQAVLSGVTFTDLKASAVMKSTSAGSTYNMGFDFFINEETHSGAAYNTTHATMGYEGYRVVLVRNGNSSENPAGTTLYLFKFNRSDSGYTRSEIAKVSKADFFADYTKYGEIEVDFSVEIIDGTFTAKAVVCEHTDKTITLTYDGLEGSGAAGWFISGGGSLTGLSIQYPLDDAKIKVAETENGKIWATGNSGAADVGETVGIAAAVDDGYILDKAFASVNGVKTEIFEGENGYTFIKQYGETEISAQFALIYDVDLNGSIGADDLVKLRKILLGSEINETKATDNDLSGNIDIIDLIRLKKKLAVSE